jgi:hypothetical protein
MNLLTAFEQIPEFRRTAGRRHSLAVTLACSLLAILNGSTSWRDQEAFARRHRDALLKHLRPIKDRLPSYSTLRRVVGGVDFDALSAAFLAWAQEHVEIAPGEWLSVDGKSLRGTAREAFDAEQNFTALVSFYAQKRGVLVRAQAYENKHESEAHVVEEMLASIEPDALRGAGLSLDALHCRKKHASSSAAPAPTT